MLRVQAAAACGREQDRGDQEDKHPQISAQATAAREDEQSNRQQQRQSDSIAQLVCRASEIGFVVVDLVGVDVDGGGEFGVGSERGRGVGEGASGILGQVAAAEKDGVGEVADRCQRDVQVGVMLGLDGDAGSSGEGSLRRR